MRARPLLILCALLVGLATGAEAQDREPRRLAPDEAEAFRSVGRLDVGGRRFCSAALVSEVLVVTAAHCLYHPRTHEPIAIGDITFAAGRYGGDEAASRGAARVAVPPDYIFDGQPRFERIRRDIALIELDAPIPAEVAPVWPLGPTPAAEGVVEIVSYARGRSRRPSLQDGCRIEAVIGPVAALDCGVNLGASGAPIFAVTKTGRALWGVLSATGTLVGGGEVTLVVRVAPEIDALEAALEPHVPDRSSEEEGG